MDTVWDRNWGRWTTDSREKWSLRTATGSSSRRRTRWRPGLAPTSRHWAPWWSYHTNSQTACFPPALGSDESLCNSNLRTRRIMPLAGLIDWVKVLRPTRHKRGHFRDVLLSQSLPNVYISLPYMMAARTAGIYRNDEITSLSTNVYFIVLPSPTLRLSCFSSLLHHLMYWHFW